MTRLRQRMIEQMQIRNYASTTVNNYVFHVAKFAQHFNKSPDLLGPEEVRAYQVFLLREKKIALSTMNPWP